MTPKQNDYQMLWELHKETTDAIKNFTIAIERLNDEHRNDRELIHQTLDKFNKTVEVNKQFVSLISKLMIAIVAALIVLAGADKALKFL